MQKNLWNFHAKSKKCTRQRICNHTTKGSFRNFDKGKNYHNKLFGGQYFLTVDEIQIDTKDVYLIEGKHSKSSLLPSKSDIKDGLLKMILYTNLKNTEVNGKTKNPTPVLLLTSSKLKSEINSNTEKAEIDKFFTKNKFKDTQKELVTTLFEEAQINNFLVILKKG